MPLTMEEIQHIATICRIGATDEELELMREQLSHILDLFQVLEELDTEAVPATGHSASLETVLRADEPGDSSSQEEGAVQRSSAGGRPVPGEGGAAGVGIAPRPATGK